MRPILSLVILMTFFQATRAQPDVELQLEASGLTIPVDIAHAGDDRLFIVEKRGLIKILNPDGSVLPSPFLNIDPRVNSTASERGLLGLAFHPDYADNGYFFVNYTNNSGDTRVSRFTVSANDPNVADPNSEVNLLAINQPFSNHNGGDLAFGPDGYLHISLGDGGSADDPGNRAQNRLNMLGKMLRIDVDSGNPYSIPEDNPFAFDDFTLDEIWAIGLRNPWRFSFDRQTGDLWIADVGQDKWEEINLQPAGSEGGENYGWRCYEGHSPFNTGGCSENYTFPVYVYAHSGANCSGSITGGFVYRGAAFPALAGHYIYADYCSGRISSLRPDGADGWTHTELLNFNSRQISTFGENAEGELFMAAVGEGQPGQGNIYRIVMCGSYSVSAQATDASCPGKEDGSVTLTVTAGEEPVAYNWSTGATSQDLGNVGAGAYSVTIVDNRGCRTTVSATVGNAAAGPEAPDIAVEDGTMLSVPDNYSSYQWLLNGSPIDGAVSNALLATEPGAYSVIVADAEGCSATSGDVSVLVTHSLEELGLAHLQLSPNPFKENLTIEVKTNSPGVYHFSILDLEGRTIWNVREALFEEVRKEVSLKYIPSGIYLFTVERDGKKAARRLVRE